MTTHRRVAATWFLVVAALILCPAAGASAAPPPDIPVVSMASSLVVPSPAADNASTLLIENNGQFDPAARFLVLSGEGRAWLATDALWLTLPAAGEGEVAGVHLRLSFPGANPAPRLESFRPLPAKVTFFLGNDPSRWRSSRTWAAVRYRDLYPGIDLVVGEGPDPRFAWRLEARPGAELRSVRLRLKGADRVAVRGAELVVSTAAGELALPLPALNGAAVPPADHRITQSAAAAFDLAAPYANPATTVATPVDAASGASAAALAGAADLLYSTFMGGGTSDPAYDVVINAAGDAVVAGRTQSLTFPTTPGAYDRTIDTSTSDGFMFILSPDGAGLADLHYATFFGGTEQDSIFGLGVDSLGRVYLAGETYSSDLPTTTNACDRLCGPKGTCGELSDAFLAVINPGGNDAADLAYSTYLGGEDEDGAAAVKVGTDGHAFLVGYTSSPAFPTTSGAYDRTCGTDGECDPFDRVPTLDAFFARLAPVGGGTADLKYATYLGGSEYDSASDLALAGSQVVIAGSTLSPEFPGGPTVAGSYDAYALRLNPAGGGTADLVYSRLLGGASFDYGAAIAVDPSGAVTVAGSTGSAGFPVTESAYDTGLGGATDAFLAVLTPAGAVDYATFLGGSGTDEVSDVTLDNAGRAYLAGVTKSADFPVTPSAYDIACGTTGTCLDGGGYLRADGFAVRFDRSQPVPLEYASYLGGELEDEPGSVAIASDSTVLMVGATKSTDFPTTTGAYDTIYNGGQRDAFLSVLRLQPTGDLRITKVVEWNGITALPGQSFQICVTGPGLLTISTCKDFNATNGWMQTWSGLVPGDYTITEPGAGAEWDVDLPAGPVTVAANDTAEAIVTNTHKLGRLEVTKSVTWNGVTPVADAFEICITSPSHPTTPSCQIITTAQVAAAETLLWENLLPGEYTVTETAQDEWSTEVVPTTVAVPADGTTTSALISNTRKLGSLEITKNVLWNEVTPVVDTTFEICIQGPSYPLGTEAGSCKVFTYPGGLTQTWLDLIPGDCTIVETDPGSKWTVSIDPSSASVPVDGGTGKATVTNTRLPDKPPKAPQVRIAASGIGANLTDARLTWPKVDTDEEGTTPVTVVAYRVWRSESPYFVPNPDEPHGTVTTNLDAPSFTDPGVVADKDFNYYYTVQAVSDAGLSSDFSNRVGEFTFGLTPGS